MNKLTHYATTGKKVFFVGIGGVGMSALARILAAKGLLVSGSDSKNSKMCGRLEAEGILVHTHQNGELTERPDFAVYSSAIAKTNPDFQRLIEWDVPMFHRAEVLS